MTRIALLVVATVCLVLTVSGQPTPYDVGFNKSFSVEKTVQLDVDPTKALGTGFGAVTSTIVPNDANRAACESYGFIDDDLKTGNTAQHGIWSFAKGLADTFIPRAASRIACINMGYYHPDEDKSAAATPAP